ETFYALHTGTQHSAAPQPRGEMARSCNVGLAKARSCAPCPPLAHVGYAAGNVLWADPVGGVGDWPSRLAICPFKYANSLRIMTFSAASLIAILRRLRCLSQAAMPPTTTPAIRTV